MGFFDRLLGRSPPPPGTLARAEALMEECDYEQAWKLSSEAVGRHRFATDALAARLQANLGECAFQLGIPRRARAATLRALYLARQRTDTELVLAVLGNLYEVHRYMGDTVAAADIAEELAALCPDEERRYRRQVALVRQGEPLLRVVADVEGRRHELEDVLTGITGPVRLVYERNRLTLRLAHKWTLEGEEFAQAGAFAQAIERYDAAAQLDPFAPEPAYQAGFVRGHEGRWDQARDYFESADRLAPGWFHSRSALALVRLNLPADTFRLWHALAEGPLSHEAKRQLAEQALATTPMAARAYFHHLHGKALQGSKRPEAEPAFRRGLEHAAEPDLATRLCVDLAAVVASAQEKTRLLRRAVEIDGDLVAVARAKIVLAFE